MNRRDDYKESDLLAGRAGIAAPIDRRVPAGLVSFSLHVLLFVALAFLVKVAPRITVGDPDRSTGIALVDMSSNGTIYSASTADSSGASAESTTPASRSTDALPSSDTTPIDLSGVLPSPSEGARALNGLAASGLGRSTDLSGTTASSKGALATTSQNGIRTGVYGTISRGNRFVYVFDRSGSMGGFEGRPIRSAKSQLVASLADLGEDQQFQIVFYNDRVTVFNPSAPLSPRMISGRPAEKRTAEQFIRDIRADGGTEHLDALLQGLAFRPDVVFFLTDADEPELSAAELRKIQDANHGAVINAIEFGVGPRRKTHNFLAEIARQNSGQYTYVDVMEL